MKRCAVAVFLLVATVAQGREPIRLANNPALSPDGQWLAFDWNGDIWLAASGGGEAKPLTLHSGRDSNPKFSPDGKTIAFVSDREGSLQVFTIPVAGGVPKQHTFHTAGAGIQDWLPDGQSLLISATRDHYWRNGQRFFTISSKDRSAEQLLFDDYGNDGALSPDGKKLLFTRETEVWWRKGYHGPRAAQVWQYDLGTHQFTVLLHKDFGSRWPLWQPDGKGFYYVASQPRGANLCVYNFDTKSTKQLTNFNEDSVVFPCIARNGSKLVFRHLFDLYCFEPSTSAVKKLDLYHNSDRAVKKTETRVLNTASAAAFTSDALEIASIAGGDLWVMDTELREPRQVTKTAAEEAEPLFSADGQAILFTRNINTGFQILKATRKNAKQYWWQNRDFDIKTVRETTHKPSKLKLSPDGEKLSYVTSRGDLCVADLASGAERILLPGWNAPDYDWSPDGKWIVYAHLDSEFNKDIWLMPATGKGKPFNVSRHPFAESDPVWSPDGKMIAFSGRRSSGEPGANVCLVWLNPEDDEATARDRKLAKALDKMKGRASMDDEAKPAAKKSDGVVIDFDRLHERVKRINLGEGFANTLFWSPDSKKLAFTGTFDGKPGTYTIEIGETMTPKSLTTTVGSHPTWLKKGNQIVWLVNGVPTSTPGVASSAEPAAEPAPSAAIPKKGFGGGKGKGKGKGFGGAGSGPAAAGGGFTFSVRQEVDLTARKALVFDTCWQLMRDHWYDSNLGNNNWDKVRDKYRAMAEQSPDMESVATVVQLMLGELNGSHLGFTLGGPPSTARPTEPRDVTAHLGVRFEQAFKGPGLKIRDVLPGSPAALKRSLLKAGEIILSIDGQPVNPSTDLTTILNGPLDRELTLNVKSTDGKTREVVLRPISYTAAQGLLYEHWLEHNRKAVAAASKDRFGYLHISQMAMPNFRKFEEELVSQGAGKEGLIIDVRENPGGSIADHLLTALSQPNHAITVPRGGGPGYPLDRKIYVSWHKPIVVLCNQNSGSNAEIFSHAIKTLKRGQLVGVQTAGAVISTGAASILDVGTLRMPTRGWFTPEDGEDMELHGAMPHHVVWPRPGELPQGKDYQLSKAIKVLDEEVEAWKSRPQSKLRKATERP